MRERERDEIKNGIEGGWKGEREGGEERERERKGT